MKEFNYVIKDELGIHARPAGMLTKLANTYESKISITKGEKTIEATKLLMLMGLGVKQGETVTIRIEGADEEAAFEGMQKFFDENL